MCDMACSDGDSNQMHAQNGSNPEMFLAHCHDVGHFCSKQEVKRQVCARKWASQDGVLLMTLGEVTPDVIDLSSWQQLLTEPTLIGRTFRIPLTLNGTLTRATISKEVNFVNLDGYFFLLVESNKKKGFLRRDDDWVIFYHWLSSQPSTCRQFFERCHKEAEDNNNCSHVHKCDRGVVCTFSGMAKSHATKRVLFIGHGLDLSQGSDQTTGISAGSTRSCKRRRSHTSQGRSVMPDVSNERKCSDGE